MARPAVNQIVDITAATVVVVCLRKVVIATPLL